MSNNTAKQQPEAPDAPWSHPTQDTLQQLHVDPETGLPAQEVQARRKAYGPNRLRRAAQRSAWSIAIEQFNNIIVFLLLAATVVSFAFGETIEAIAILAVILINAGIGFFTELKAVRSMEALQDLGEVETRVLREGQFQLVSAQALVPGDIVTLEGGDVVTADMRLIEASKLQADESALTGESVAVSKGTEAVQEDTPLAERSSMVFKGTAITRGAGKGVVVATGMQTELGHISSLVEEAEQEATPLEKRLDQLGQRLAWVTLVIAALVALAGILAGREVLLIIETAIALAVAAVPEGLPIVATVALGRGMWRMARRNALIERLSSVETLGATTVICTDKTGTLTENQMAVDEMRLAGETISLDGHLEQLEQQAQDNPRLREALKIAVLCNNASLNGSQTTQEQRNLGDPLEVALLQAGAQAGLRRPALLEDTPEAREVAFDPEIKMMATFHRQKDGYRVAVKGAPEAVLERCQQVLNPDGRQGLDEQQRQSWTETAADMAKQGLRIIAVATKPVQERQADPYQDLTLVGLLGLLDPPRKDVQQAIQHCKQAGIHVAMVTGDQAMTAKNIAASVGLIENDQATVMLGDDLHALDQLDTQARERIVHASVFARVSPEQKLNLISVFQDQEQIVAMTGDGVNDAPALKRADIGIAMGQRGTQVAREAADMILKDDAFSSIVEAVRQGRVIFNNIRKFVLYLLSCNVSEIFVVSLASVANMPLPIRPLQILFLNLVTDVFPSLALGVGEGDANILKRPPRDPQESILTRRHWRLIGLYGGLITAAVMGALLLALHVFKLPTKQAVTISFLTLAMAQLWHVFNMRAHRSHWLRNEITTNPYIWGALALCLVLILAAVYLPGLNDILGTVDPGHLGWGLAVGLSLSPTIVGQILKGFNIGKV